MGKWDKKHLGKRNIPEHMTIEEFEDTSKPYTKSNEQERIKDAETCTRKLLTFPWDDHVWEGILYKLLEYKHYDDYISEFQLGVMIHWKKQSGR